MNKNAFTPPLYTGAGFTLFEIIIAMLVVGILSALAAPKVVDLVNEARRGDELNTVGNVKSGIALTYLGNVTRGITPQYPQNLDNATLAKASSSNPVYDLVLQHGITKSWEKLEQYRYRGPTGQEYEYDPTDGSFEFSEVIPPPPPSLITWAYPGTQIASGGLFATNVSTQVSTPSYITFDITSDLLVGIAAFLEGDPGTLWQDGVYGGNSWDFLSYAQQTEDGGYLLAGSRDGVGGEDAYLVKIDSSGNLEWSKTYVGSDDEFIISSSQTTDGGYMILGQTTSFGAGGYDSFVSKIDSTGNLEWSKTYGGSGWDLPWKLEQDLDGNYLMTGYTSSFGAGSWDANLTKIDSDGNLLWSNTYGGTNRDYGGDILQTSDGGYIMTASTYSFGAGGSDQSLIKMDSDGNIEWSSTYGGGSNDWDESVLETPDGYMISGMTYSFGGGDSYLTKVNSNGTVEWSKTYGGFGWDGSISLSEAQDGNYIISSNREVDPNDINNEDFYLAKIDPDGNILWDKTYGGSDYEENWGLVPASDGGYLMAGYTYSFGSGDMDFYTIKTDQDGNIVP